MPIPIAVGGESLSSERLRGPYQGSPSSPEASERENAGLTKERPHQSVTWAVCSRNEWQARTVVSFYDDDSHQSRTKEQQQQEQHVEERNDDGDDADSQRKKKRMVEIRIQISPLIEAFSSKAYRETRYHLALLTSEDDDNDNNGDANDDGNDDGSSNSNSDGSSGTHTLQAQKYWHQPPQVIFSEDRRHLIVLLFHPNNASRRKRQKHTLSAIIVFQLRAPRTTTSDYRDRWNNIPLPSYIANNHGDDANNSAVPPSHVASTSARSPAVATNPKFVPCWGVTAICRLGGGGSFEAVMSLPHTDAAAATNHDVRRNRRGAASDRKQYQHDEGNATASSPSSSPNLFLAMRSDGTLIWVDTQSAQVIATARLPSQFRTTARHGVGDDNADSPSDIVQHGLLFGSMKTSPTSTLERGLLAMVVTSSPRCGEEEDDDDGLAVRGGDCVLVEWSRVSTTLKQKTFPRRGSTGHVTFHGDTQQWNENETQNGRRRRSVARRVSSRNVHGGNDDNPLQRTFRNMLGISSRKLAATVEEKEERRLRKEHMDRFVLQELKKRRIDSASISSPSLLSSSSSLSSPSFYHGREGAKLFPVAIPHTSPAAHLQRFPRRRSTAAGESGEMGYDPAMPMMHMSMHVRLVSVWSPPTVAPVRNQQPSESASYRSEVLVGDVCFGSVPSVLCVVYHADPVRRDSAPLGPVQRVAQILTISNAKDRDGWDLVPAVSLHLSSEQIEHAPSVGNGTNDVVEEAKGEWRNYNSSLDGSSTERDTERNETTENPGGGPLQSQLIGIEHDLLTDSFVINSVFSGDKKRHWYGCVWNWRSNAIGLMVQNEIASPCFSQNYTTHEGGHPLWARLYPGRDPYIGGGSYLVYIHSLLRDDNSHCSMDYDDRGLCLLENKKITVSTALLSPSNSVNPNIFTERCSLLLAKDHVSFPRVSVQDSNTTLRKLDWMISALPLTYINSYGAPRIAAIGATNANSIAVASTFGVCVVNANRHDGNRWKQFGSPSEEGSFSVVSMTWWEGSPAGTRDDEREDLLVAVTQTRTGEQFLSCWSSKRLDMMNQLMDTPDLEWKPGESQDPDPSFGIPLPKDIRVTNISLLCETEQGLPRGHGNPRRAVVLVYSPDLVSTECEYLVFRLQVFRNKLASSHSTTESYISRRPFYVMAESTLRASMKHDRFIGPVTSAFIAGASFHYDFRISEMKKVVPKIIDSEHDFLVTLGVNRTSGGMYALSVFRDGRSCTANLSNFQASKCQLSDIVLSEVASNADRKPVVRYAWNIELLNGEILSWHVPSFVAPLLQGGDCEMGIPNVEEGRFGMPGVKQPKGLCPPILVCNKSCASKAERFALGTLCDVGSVSDWAFQSSSGCQTDISLGSVPQSRFGCVLRCGQKTQKLRRTQIGDIATGTFASNILDMKTYSQSMFSITPPAFVISLYTLLLEAASMQPGSHGEDSKTVEEERSHLKEIESQIQRRLTSAENTDMSMMALRLIIFRTLEMITRMDKRHMKNPSQSSESYLLLSQNVLSTVVDAVRGCTNKLQFASLFLEVGRQTEPSNLQHLFPLPLPNKRNEMENKPNTISVRSVIDLFTACIDEGSLAASASALPLLTSRDQARHYCGLLLDEAIDNFVQNATSSKWNFDKTEEERRALGDFFRFGIKLEDAERIEGEFVTESQEEILYCDNNSVNTTDGSSSNESYVLESPERTKRNLVCSLNASSSILNYIVPSSMVVESENQKIEEAIRREVSSFIGKSLDFPSLDFSVLPQWDDYSVDLKSNGVRIHTVASLAGEALLDLLQLEHNDNKWRTIAALSKMILPEGVEHQFSFDLFVEVANKSQPLNIMSVISESYDVYNGIEENVTAYIEDEINACRLQIDVADADLVVSMALMLLERLRSLPLSDLSDQAVMEIGLAVIVMVGCNVGGRSQSFQHMLEHDSMLNKCYSKASDEIK